MTHKLPLQEIETRITFAASVAHQLVQELATSDPGNRTFEQVGILDGQQIVLDYLAGEWTLALDHLLYVIHESDILYPRELMLELHQIAQSYQLDNFYSKESQANLAQVRAATIFNAP